MFLPVTCLCRRQKNYEQQVSSTFLGKPVAKAQMRHWLCPVAARRVRAAELRYEAAAQRRSGSGRDYERADVMPGNVLLIASYFRVATLTLSN